MKHLRKISVMMIVVLVSVTSALAQRNGSAAYNSALRYWAAFSEVRDSAITDQQAKELNAILDGTAPYDDLKYKDLLEKNALALQIMARATSLPYCDWGLDTQLGEDVPVDYARKALVLGRLNVLNVFHLFINGNKDAGVDALISGLKFSRDVGNGGSFFATLIAKDLLVNHLRAMAGAVHLQQFSDAQRSRLQQAVVKIGGGLDWSNAARWEMEALKLHFAKDAQVSGALSKISSAYVAALNDPSKLSALNDAIASAPHELASLIPNAKRVLEEKQDLSDEFKQTRALLQ
jgi:hypothetical protein